MKHLKLNDESIDQSKKVNILDVYKQEDILDMLQELEDVWF